tara:strand:- start:3868 stop:5514 length:1647 start_codon:yes stop_codon:yes gene_type:complete
MNNRILESLIESIKVNYLVNSRDAGNNFIYNTFIIVFITIFANYISNNDIYFGSIPDNIYKIKNLLKKKNSFFLEGKRSMKNSDYLTRTDSLFSDRFLAFWNYINKNSMDNSEIYSFKEYAESSNLYDENGDSKFSRRSIRNAHLKNSKDIFIVNQYKPFTISDNLFCKVDFDTEKLDDKRSTVTETINIEIFSYILTKKYIEEFLDRLVIEHRKELEEIRHNKKFIYTLVGNKNNSNNDYDEIKNTWEECEFNSTRNFNNMFFDQKKNLLDKLNFFEKNRTWYEYEGHPYTFGIGLHGPPGTGKTSIIKCIANKLNRHIIVIPLSKIKTQAEFSEYFFENRYNRYNTDVIGFDNKIIVFEDIDCMSNIVKQREISDNNSESSIENNFTNVDSGDEKSNDKVDKNTLLQNKLLNKIAKKIDKEHDETTMIVDFEKDKNDKITLSFILNIIDGIRETPGRILIITSNNYKSLDSALVRPGRIDYTLEMKNASIDVIKEMYNHYYGCIIPDSICENLIDYKISQAKIVNLRLEYTNGEDFLKALVKEFKN